MSLGDAELARLLGDLESDRVERKESFKGDAPAKARGFVQHYRAVIPTARWMLAQNGLPPLHFDVQPEFVAATLRPRR